MLDIGIFTHLSHFCVGRWHFQSFELFLCWTLVFSLIWVVFVLDVGIITHLSLFCAGHFCCPSLCRRMNHNTPFHSHHDVEFGLRVFKRSAGASTTVVTTVERLQNQRPTLVVPPNVYTSVKEIWIGDVFLFLSFFWSGLRGSKAYSLWGGVVPSPSIGYDYLKTLSLLCLS